MGMDLSVKTFRHEPEYFEAGPHPVAKAVKTAAADLAAHAPVALDDSGKLVAVTSANKANIYGLLPEEAAADEELLAREVARRLSPGIPADLGAGWFEGLAGKNRYALIARLSLWRQLDSYLSGLDDETFKRALVFLRRAFADFSPKEKNDISENLGEIWGVSPQQTAELLMNETTEAEQAVLESLSDFDFDDI